MTPKEIADILGVRIRSCSGNHAKGGCDWERVLQLSESIATALRDARESARDECCKLICDMCAQCYPLRYARRWMHDPFPGQIGHMVRCHAYRIRALRTPEKEGNNDTRRRV